MLNNNLVLNNTDLAYASPVLVMGGFTLLCVSGYILLNYFYGPTSTVDISLDKEVQTLNSTSELGIQTINTTKEVGVQTSLKLLDKLIGDIQLEDADTFCSTRLTQNLEIYKSDPQYAEFFKQKEVQEWLAGQDVASTNSSEINFLMKLREDLKSISNNSPILDVRPDGPVGQTISANGFNNPEIN
jgi:hypothetical protein